MLDNLITARKLMYFIGRDTGFRRFSACVQTVVCFDSGDANLLQDKYND
jgi:hypothetical protein